MLKFLIKLPYVVRRVERAGHFPHDQTVTEHLIRNAVAARFPQGIKAEPEQDLWADIEDKLINAAEPESGPVAESIELSLEQIRWLGKTMQEWSVPSGLVPWARVLRRYIDGLLLEAKQAGEKKPEPAKVEEKK